MDEEKVDENDFVEVVFGAALEKGYEKDGKFYLPRNFEKPVEPSKMAKGIAAAKGELQSVVKELRDIATHDLELKEVEFSISFSAKGEFLGIGAGGATSVKIKFAPLAEES